MRLLKLLHRFIGDSGGFTLLEVMVAISILTMGVGMIGTGVFQVLSGARFWQENVVATKDLRHAGSWFASDALNAKTTDLIDGAAAVNTVMLTTFGDNEITYSLSGSDLIRSFDDGMTVAQTKVATDVVSADFSLAGDILTFSLEVTADHGGTKTISLNTRLR